ncbi:expressed unknown protein [Seminavis robusta]|uniref:EF-hand domain-containing protein n=1 Tax=Seminavis robusta TaxID=568900 RepID=A0A9N8E484_9STRA|nr:expressed unknown protein [Seminavis robusta]|eukprot:Sro526_g160510.1 n/a (989) ;mRNA; f:53976-57130
MKELQRRRRRQAVAAILVVYTTACVDPVKAFSSSSSSFATTSGWTRNNHRTETAVWATVENDTATNPLDSSYFLERNGKNVHHVPSSSSNGQRGDEEDNWFSDHYMMQSQDSFDDSFVKMEEPFFAQKITTPLVIVSNGHGEVVANGFSRNGAPSPTLVSSTPPPVNGRAQQTNNGRRQPVQMDVLASFDQKTATPLRNATKTSRVRRAFRAVRHAWGQVSPGRIFRDNTDFEVASASPQPKDIPAEKAKKKKQAKEEAIVARQSLRKKRRLSNLLERVNRRNTKKMAGITSRTLTGLIHALAEEAEGLSVRMDAREETPFWRKQIDTVSIEFTRLGFKPLHMGGPDQQLVSHDDDPAVVKKKQDKQQVQKEVAAVIAPTRQEAQPEPVNQQALLEEEEDDECPVKFTADETGHPIAEISCADTAFSQIDVDNSGALDKDEIADALVIAASASSSSGITENSDPEVEDTNRKMIQKLAKQLVDLYDANDDGVIDREEYQSMVDDMAALRQLQKEKEGQENNPSQEEKGGPWWASAIGSVLRLNSNKEQEESLADIADGAGVAAIADSVPETTGKIVMENLKIDLRQLVFGAIPILRYILPGGPLVLEPMKATVIGSFSADDIMKSSLLDAGLRQLVSFALRVRVRSFRDLADGAVFYGRKWKRGSAIAPLVECTELTSVEFDDKDRIIVTGRAKVRASKNAPVIDNSFKLRTKVATPRNGRAIKLSEPEIAIVLECPKQWEQNLNSTFARMKMKPPSKPKPIYTYIPIHSPFKKDDDTGGYYMGEDNRLNSLSIKDKCLRFEMEAILRPGRFLGSHYLAFTVPQRALIITVDRVREGMKAARRRKKALKALNKARARETDRKAHHAEDALALDSADFATASDGASPTFSGSGDSTDNDGDDKEDGEAPKGPSFISRFVDGYLQAGAAEESKEKLAHAISDWFGRQGGKKAQTEGSNSAAGIESPMTKSEVSQIVEDITFEQFRKLSER